MKRFLALILIAGLLTMAVPALADRQIVVVHNPEPVEDNIGVQEGTELNACMVTAMDGYFSTNQWGNNAADLSIRAMLHGYSTITYTRNGNFMFDGMAVAGVTTDGDGETKRDYIISFMVDLTYNDGTPITAKDYAFSLLLTASPLIAELGGDPRDISQYLGGDDYSSGKTKAIKGVRLVSDYALAVEIDPSCLPYFYGISILDITPYPISVIAPGCEVKDDGDGIYLDGEFDLALLQKTMMDPDTGYVYNPKVTSGPYQLGSYDKDARIATLTLNRAYMGNYEGIKPHIEKVTLREAPSDMVRAMFESGEIDLVTELVSGEVVTDLMQSREQMGLQMESYARTGLAYLALACEKGVTQDVAVRRALAQSIDKASIIASVSPYSMAVHGYYGLGQWMPNYKSAADEDLSTDAPQPPTPSIDAPSEVQALEVPFDLEAAKSTLDAAGWNRSEDGGAYASGTRYRQGESGLEPLTLRWAKTQSPTADKVLEVIAPALDAVGFDLIVTEMPFVQVLQLFYRQIDRTDYDMFFLASDFMQSFDPYYEYQADAAYQGTLNTTGLVDEELTNLAGVMRNTNGTEVEQYVRRWLDFQRAWVERMPLIPLYSNAYFDFYASGFQGYDNAVCLNWGYAIPGVYIADAPIEGGEPAAIELESDGEVAGEDDLDDGKIVIVN